MQEDKSVQVVFVLTVLLALVAYFAGLRVDVTRDAAKYATVAKELYHSGDWVHLTVRGEAYDQKPPLLFWMASLGYAVGGISVFWFKLPILLLTFAGFYWAFKLGTSLYNRRVGAITAFLMFFSLVYPMYTTDIHTDTPLQAFVTLALWQLSEFIKNRRSVNCFWGFFAIGLAMLSKGPVGAVVPAFAVLGHLIFTRNWTFMRDYRWYLGVLFSFAMIVPALVGLWDQFGWQGIHFFFWDNNMGRFLGTYTDTFSDPFFYLHTLLYLLLPWSLLFYVAAFFEFRQLWRNRGRSSEYFTLTGIWIFLVILNLSRSQLPNYVFILVPLIAVLTAKWIVSWTESSVKVVRRLTVVQFFVFVSVCVFLLALCFYAFPNSGFLCKGVVFGGILAAAWVYYQARQGLTRLLLPPALAFSVLVFVLTVYVFPEMFAQQAPVQAAKYFNEHREGRDSLYNYNYGQYELFFYSHPQAKHIPDLKTTEQIVADGRSWVFTDKAGLDSLFSLQEEPDTVIRLNHFSMKRAGRYLDPQLRQQLHDYMYLVKY